MRSSGNNKGMGALRVVTFFATILAIVYFGSKYQVLNLVERDAPVVDLASVPAGLGVESVEFPLQFSDSGAGVESIAVQLAQGEKSVSLVNTRLAQSEKLHTVQVSVEKLKSEFTKGPAQLQILVQDASIWGNQTAQNVEVQLDFEKPKLAVLSQQFIASQGGAEFVLVEAIDTNLKEVLATHGTTNFEAIPAEKFDSSLTGRNIYALLLAIPLGAEAEFALSAIDEVGNTTTLPLSFRLKPRKLRPSTPKLSMGFYEQKVIPLYQQFKEEYPEDAVVSTDPVAVFREVNESYRAKLQERLAAISLSDAPIPVEVFEKPMPSSTTSNFGESRSYSLDGTEAGGSRHDGLDLASVKRDQVLAAQAGTVVYAADLGIYGNTVVLDHGMGLTSLYGHLSSIAVTEGATVSKKQVLGRSGETGLAGGDHLHFEFRIVDIPVTPVEWWDAHWIEDNIKGKIEALKRDLGITS